MAEKDPGRSTRGSRPEAASEDYPVTSSHAGYPSGDYSYTVELVGAIQNQLGKLTEAVETLKTQTAEHSNKLSDIGKDIHTAKTTLKIIGAIIAALMAFIGWIGNKAVDAFVQSHQPAAATHQAKP
jgi:hypothetical protein